MVQVSEKQHSTQLHWEYRQVQRMQWKKYCLGFNLWIYNEAIWCNLHMYDSSVYPWVQWSNTELRSQHLPLLFLLFPKGGSIEESFAKGCFLRHGTIASSLANPTSDHLEQTMRKRMSGCHGPVLFLELWITCHEGISIVPRHKPWVTKYNKHKLQTWQHGNLPCVTGLTLDCACKCHDMIPWRLEVFWSVCLNTSSSLRTGRLEPAPVVKLLTSRDQKDLKSLTKSHGPRLSQKVVHWTMQCVISNNPSVHNAWSGK